MAPVSRGPSILPPLSQSKDGDRHSHTKDSDQYSEEQPIFPSTSKHSPATSAALGPRSIGAWFAASVVLGAALGFALVVLLLRTETSVGPQDPAQQLGWDTAEPQLLHAAQLHDPAAAAGSDPAAMALTGARKSAIQLALSHSFLPHSFLASASMPSTKASSTVEGVLDGAKDSVHCSDVTLKEERAHVPLVWVPQPGRFLLAACTYGYPSNRFKCLKRTLIAGALLNRTVVIPEQDMCPPAVANGSAQRPPYRVDVQVFLPGLKSCLNASRDAPPGQAPWHGAGAITLGDFLAHDRNGSMTVDLSILDPLKVHRTTACRLAAHVAFPRHTTWSRRFTNLTQSDVGTLRNATAPARVLFLGDLFYFNVEGLRDDISNIPRVAVQGTAEALQPKGLDPRSYGPSACQPLLRPHPHFIDRARDFIAEYAGSHFAALHLRRGDFISHCRAVAASCPSCEIPRCTYLSLEELAVCISAKMKRLRLTCLFVATNAGQQQVQFLKEHLGARGVFLFVLTGVPWKQDSQEYAMMEKIVASQASVFFHTDHSTFSEHISELRAAIGKGSCEDGPPCP